MYKSLISWKSWIVMIYTSWTTACKHDWSVDLLKIVFEEQQPNFQVNSNFWSLFSALELWDEPLELACRGWLLRQHTCPLLKCIWPSYMY